MTEILSAEGVHEYEAGSFKDLDAAVSTVKRIVDRSLAEMAARGRRGDDLYEYYSLYGSHPRIIGDADVDFSVAEYARQRSAAYTGESWYLLAELGRFAEAEPLMLSGTEFDDGYGEATVARAEFYEAWGDQAADHAIAEKAFREAERYYATFASWATSGGEGTARMMDVNRVLKKLKG